ncbi:hypothetical protein Tcan_03534 [Toxocara canis]|uniref:Uncharacterized protein n=1 Tax=Toxocara canis TaxID=6265 RepID=A0A0B2VLN9_TOXCA|nr:hypothetical protein Tcan_03534 [Toxocara canis]
MDNASVYGAEDCLFECFRGRHIGITNLGTALSSRRLELAKGRVGKWTTRRSSEPKIAGSSPAVVEDIGHYTITQT